MSRSSPASSRPSRRANSDHSNKITPYDRGPAPRAPETRRDDARVPMIVAGGAARKPGVHPGGGS
ncbi:hypothetical protein GCM10009736_22410 [Actinomadura bangladeshensis]